jgi:hypothetical protein
MSAIAKFNRNTFRMVFLAGAGLIVTAGLLAWQYAGNSAAERGYSVTIEQLQ